MNELKEILNQLAIQTAHVDLTEEEIRADIRSHSLGVIETLARKIFYKFLLCVLFAVFLGVGIPFISPQVSQILLTVLLVAYIVGAILLYQEHRKLKKGIDMTDELHKALTTYHQQVKAIIRYEELVSLFLYPVSATAGYLIGMYLYNRNADLMNDPSDWILLTFALIIFIPASHFFSRWMNKRSFEKYLSELEDTLKEMG